MRKALCGILIGIMAIIVIALPVLASYYAYIYVEESDGNSYDELPVICSTNIAALAENHFITSTGLDTRVLTGSGETLPHMLADDKILFTTDLEAYEDKTLIFYTGATSLSSFPIIVGRDGYITTLDDEDLELGYVLEALYSGSFDASAGDEKYIHYKEDAWRVSILAANTLRVAALETGGAEQWEMHYSSFSSGEHTVYVMANGLRAYLYVDDFEVAKDTANLFDSTSYQCINKDILDGRCFYDEDYYWVFYKADSANFGYITSPDGLSWSGETTFAIEGGDSLDHWDAKMRDGYLHICYADFSGTDYIRYRRGDLTSAPGITWSDDWQEVDTETGGAGYSLMYPLITIDEGGYPYIAYQNLQNYNDIAYCTKSSANDGTWVTAGGYPWQVYSEGANNGVLKEFMYYPNSNKLLLLWDRHGYDTLWDWTSCRYYNGSSWEPEDVISTYIGDIGAASMAADDNDNMYIGWNLGSSGTQRLTVRHDGEVWETITINSDPNGYGTPRLSYNEDNNVLYILYGYTPGTNYVYCVTLNTDEMELNTPVAIMPLLDTALYGVNAYEDHIGFLLWDSPNTFHGLIDLTAYSWNDNSNNWTWMQNDVMPYADDFQMAIDGELVLEYKPATIIQGTTLPDEESDHDGIITWGSNPSGVDVSISQLQFDEDESGSYYYQPIAPGHQDVITPEPAEMTTDVDLERLENNPFNPMVEAMASMSNGKLTERLIWLGGGFFLLIAATIATFILSKHNMLFTSLVGLGISILWYSWFIFPLWVVILFAFGVVASLVYERMPTL